MKSLSDLSQEQTTALQNWAEEGVKLADMQTRLKDEFALKLTYLEMQLIASDLQLVIKSERSTGPVDLSNQEQMAAARKAHGREEETPAPPKGVSVRTDSVARPGMIVSGKATFTDGQTAEWSLDQMGRLALKGPSPDYRPSESDLASFQQELQKLLQKEGF
ncbi:MAG: hypothetical protein AAF555_12000 [Verrucomicrobiota bacterium]